MNEQDDAKAFGEINQPLQQTCEQEVQLSQAHQGEYVGGEHQVGLVGEPENRGNGIEREDQVGDAEREDDQKHRGHRPLRPLFDKQLETVPPVGGIQVVASEPDGRILHVRVMLGAACQPDRGVNQKCAEKVEDPREPLDGRRAKRDEDAAENQRDYDTDEQRLSLIDLGHVEARHDDDENEQVVDRQAVLSEPSRKEFQGELPAMEVPRPDSKANRESDIGRQRDRATAHRRFPGPTRHNRDVEQQHCGRRTQSDDPFEHGHETTGASGR